MKGKKKLFRDRPSNVPFVYRGYVVSIANLSDVFNIHLTTLKSRWKRWNKEAALCAPADGSVNHKTSDLWGRQPHVVKKVDVLLKKHFKKETPKISISKVDNKGANEEDLFELFKLFLETRGKK